MAVFGDTLRQARAHLGVTLKEAEQTTRISRHHLLALEEEQFDDLPALIYQRGFVRNYATYLRLDPGKLISMFEEARGGSPEDLPMVAQTQPIEVPSHWVPNFAFLAFVVVMSAVVFAWMYSAYFAPDGQTPTTTELIPTVTAVSGDSFVLPSPTPAPPTPTATATSEATQQLVEPTGTAQPADQPTAGVTQANASDVVDYVTPDTEATTVATGSLSLDFTATTDIESLKIAGDGTVLFDDSLAAGASTGYLSADQFDIYVSDPTALEINKEGEDPFTMGGNNFQLP
jgi:cytoskeleton protein RodZ